MRDQVKLFDNDNLGWNMLFRNKEKCSDCEGNGTDGFFVCPRCGGSGTVYPDYEAFMDVSHDDLLRVFFEKWPNYRKEKTFSPAALAWLKEFSDFLYDHGLIDWDNNQDLFKKGGDE